MAKFLKSLADDSKGYFGSRWGVAAILLSVVIFWPVAIFGPSLSFDPATFTEEWLKMGIGGLLLLLFIEFLSHNREDRILRQSADTFLVHCYIAPLSSLRLALDELKTALASLPKSGRNAQIPDLLTSFSEASRYAATNRAYASRNARRAAWVAA